MELPICPTYIIMHFQTIQHTPRILMVRSPFTGQRHMGMFISRRLGQHPFNVPEDMTKEGWINQWSWSATVSLACTPPQSITQYTEAKLHIWTGEVVLLWGGHHSPSSWCHARRLLQRTSVGLAFLYLQSLKGTFDILPFQPKLWHFIILPSNLELAHFSTAIDL